MKRILKIAFWLLFSVGLFLTMGFVERKQADRVDKVRISIKHSGENRFVTEDLIRDIVETRFGYDIDSVKTDELDLDELELFLASQNEIKSVQVFRSVEGHLSINVIERNPIVRIIHRNGTGNYYDEDGRYMALSGNYTAHVLIVSGHINENGFQMPIDIIESNADLDSILVSDEVFQLARFIHNDEFWRSQIQQVNVTASKEFELTPRVGDHKIIFGDVRNMERKFAKLKIFYKEGLNNTGWNSFKTINIKYKNQVVCT